MIPLGEVVQAVRLRSKLSARELSARAGLSPSYITKLESGTVEPSLRAFARIAKVLNLSSAEIVFIVLQEGLRSDTMEDHDRS